MIFDVLLRVHDGFVLSFYHLFELLNDELHAGIAACALLGYRASLRLLLIVRENDNFVCVHLQEVGHHGIAFFVQLRLVQIRVDGLLRRYFFVRFRDYGNQEIEQNDYHGEGADEPGAPD